MTAPIPKAQHKRGKVKASLGNLAPRKSMAVKMAEGDIPLTAQQCEFVKFLAEGMPPSAAARHANFAHPNSAVQRLMSLPNILAALQIERAKYEREAQMTRKKVMDGLLESIEMARVMSEPITMIAGWREVAKMCGYYEPTKTKIDISVNGRLLVSRIQAMPDEELLALAEGEIHEGEFARCPQEE
jgi:hypothetical protein